MGPAHKLGSDLLWALQFTPQCLRRTICRNAPTRYGTQLHLLNQDRIRRRLISQQHSRLFYMRKGSETQGLASSCILARASAELFPSVRKSVAHDNDAHVLTYLLLSLYWPHAMRVVI